MHCQTWDWKWALHGSVEIYTYGSGGKRAAAAAIVLIRQDGEEYLRGLYGYGLDDEGTSTKAETQAITSALCIPHAIQDQAILQRGCGASHQQRPRSMLAIEVDITLSRTDHKVSAVETEVTLRVPMRQRTRNQPNEVTVRAHLQKMTMTMDCSQMAFGDTIQWCTNFNEHAKTRRSTIDSILSQSKFISKIRLLRLLTIFLRKNLNPKSEREHVHN